MKQYFLLLPFLLLTQLVAGQNSLKIESKIAVVNLYQPTGGGLVINSGALPGGYTTVSSLENYQKALETICSFYNKMGFRLVNQTFAPTLNSGESMLGFGIYTGGNSVTKYLYLNFEKADSFKEIELNRLISEINTKIENKAQYYVDSAMTQMNLNLLEYLKQIPTDVITQEYKTIMTEAFKTQAENSFKEVITKLKSEIAECCN